MRERLVEAERGGERESEHRVAWCIAQADGTVVAEGGERGACFLRSAAKPFQALVGLRAGALERFGLGDRHLAIACASHGGSDAHVEVVQEILDTIGLAEEALACGRSSPRDARVLAAPSRLRHNCSGKHALALAACVANDWPIEGYAEAAHPLQQAMRETVTAALAARGHRSAEAIDGCGMRTLTARLQDVAASFARLASGVFAQDGAQVVSAMTTHPELVAYDGAIDTELLRAGVVAKIGAEGLLAIGLPDGRGAALKVLDGSQRALDPAAVLLVAGAPFLAHDVDTPALRALARPAVCDSRGDVVGSLRVSVL